MPIKPAGRATLEARPFLKWAGGKGQLLPQFAKLFPQALLDGTIRHFYEPFLGGGAVFFFVMQNYPLKSATLLDANPELVLAYQAVQNDLTPLIKILAQMERSYHKLTEDKRREEFLKVRSEFNRQKVTAISSINKADKVERAAQLLFLNKTCFNGLFRVNQHGIFNVPFGSYVNPSILNVENLTAASKILSQAEIRLGDFGDLIRRGLKVKKNSFVYYDPPYRPLTSTANFNAYSKKSFDDLEQKRLAAMFKTLDQQPGIFQMLSNSDPKNIDPQDDFFESIYPDYLDRMVRVPASRQINSNAQKRGKINEIVITNYKNKVSREKT